MRSGEHYKIKHMTRIQFMFLTLLLVAGCMPATGTGHDSLPGRPVNIILMIGDGMGVSHLSVPYYYLDREPVFNRFRSIGLAGTSSATHPVTQSSAAATAFSTGVKTYNAAVGVGPDSLARKNIVEIASARGYQTGVISTSSITDATPAGFYAHVPDRHMQREIALDLIESEIDFFAGGGLKYFIDTTGRDLFREHGVTVNFAKLQKIEPQEASRRYGFLLAMDRMPAMLEGRGDFLEDASGIATDFLSRSDSGFFLMVEGSQIDWAGHGKNADYLISEMIDFENAVKRVLEFAERDGNTLVIVTADHETGGFTLAAAGDYQTGTDYGTIVPTFSTTNHSASLVPVLAFGPGAEHFAGIYENIELFNKMVALITSP